MTYAEIRASLQSLTKQEREGLALDLRAIALLDDPEYVAELTRLMDEAEAGATRFMDDQQLRAVLMARRQVAA